ncbi:hypothetical protein BDK51DRAFT_30574 [Blyttiomyces helicus]|uniref:Uncharacterized protein n=1 Tax=Blyttiomyces helicus TaxID=388810 RepID=A0A4P9WA01_9FUNG|nr:hypothetical protein BDK51DRAFT_30574 [Blyttiomyces helicus]|eukprot:RKO87978.1 hypothetical protein BDK51DRAFT_30574 [Blyttiomyces helicus]
MNAGGLGGNASCNSLSSVTTLVHLSPELCGKWGVRGDQIEMEGRYLLWWGDVHMDPIYNCLSLQLLCPPSRILRRFHDSRPPWRRPVGVPVFGRCLAESKRMPKNVVVTLEATHTSNHRKGGGWELDGGTNAIHPQWPNSEGGDFELELEGRECTKMCTRWGGRKLRPSGRQDGEVVAPRRVDRQFLGSREQPLQVCSCGVRLHVFRFWGADFGPPSPPSGQLPTTHYTCFDKDDCTW